MDNLPATQGHLIEPPNGNDLSLSRCSPGLKKLLLEGEDGRSAVRLIAINKTLRAETERLLPALERAREAAPEAEILGILVRHAPHFGISAKMAGEWGSFFGIYLDALAGLSAYAIEDAFVRWNRGEGHADIRMAGFYPKAPQLYLLATTARNELATAVYRAKRAMEYVENQAPRDIPPAEQKKVAEDFKALAAQLHPRRIPDQLAPAPRMSPQQMADQLRAMADRRPADDVGDVI